MTGEGEGNCGLAAPHQPKYGIKRILRLVRGKSDMMELIVFK